MNLNPYIVEYRPIPVMQLRGIGSFGPRRGRLTGTSDGGVKPGLRFERRREQIPRSTQEFVHDWRDFVPPPRNLDVQLRPRLVKWHRRDPVDGDIAPADRPGQCETDGVAGGDR